MNCRVRGVKRKRSPTRRRHIGSFGEVSFPECGKCLVKGVKRRRSPTGHSPSGSFGEVSVSERDCIRHRLSGEES